MLQRKVIFKTSKREMGHIGYIFFNIKELAKLFKPIDFFLPSPNGNYHDAFEAAQWHCQCLKLHACLLCRRLVAILPNEAKQYCDWSL